MPLTRLTSRRMPAWLIGGNVAVMLLVLALSSVALVTSQRSFQLRATDATNNLALSVSQAIDAELDRIDMTLRAVVIEQAREAGPPGLQLRRQHQLVDGLAELFATDAEGRVIDGSSPPREASVAEADYFVQLRNQAHDGVALGGLQQIGRMRWEVVLARRLLRADRSFAGVVFARIPVSNFQDRFATVNLGRHGAISLRLLPSLTLVARHTPGAPAASGVGTNKVSEELAVALQAHPTSGSYIARTALDQIERASAYRRMDGYPLLVIVGLGTGDFLAPWYSEVAVVVGLCLLTGALLAGSTWLVLRARRRELLSSQALVASEAFLDRTGRIAAVGGWELDVPAQRITWSAQTCRLLDMPPGHRPTLDEALQFVAPEAREQVRAQLESGPPGSSWMLEMPLVSATGRALWARVVAEVEGEAGRPLRVVGAVQDITEQRRNKAELAREQALRAQIEAHAQELDAMAGERGEMLDVLAHEVRQPLNNASAALQSAATELAGVGEAGASMRLSRAQAVMSQVMGRLDNTLAVASLLARPDPIEREDADIDAVVAVAIADMPAELRPRVRIERATSTRTASMDMSLMRLALRNLLSNALKHAPEGSPVTVRISDSDHPLALVLEVIDGGPGVPAELVPRLFERGARGSRQGHGLGLYIVRRVMELHEGRVELASNQPGQVTMRLVVVQAPSD